MLTQSDGGNGLKMAASSETDYGANAIPAPFGDLVFQTKFLFLCSTKFILVQHQKVGLQYEASLKLKTI